jgi:2,3-bisphosphoglycerate-independent phosphoglycerate mutase
MLETNSRALLIVIDGLGDRPIPELGRLTPLEAAYTPNMNRLAAGGITGMMDPLAPGVRVGTDVGHLGLFGYNPFNIYWGRGPIEAVGVDLPLEDGDVALRANFATVDDSLRVLDRRAGRIRKGTEKLASALNGMKLANGTRVVFRQAIEHRAVLVLKGKGLSAELTDSDPGPNREGEPLKRVESRIPGFPPAEQTASLVNEFIDRAHKILSDHPVNKLREKKGLPKANIVITRGAGMRMKPRGIADRFNIRGACIAGETVVLGIARMAGFETFTSKRFTANIDTDLMGKAELALKKLSDHNLVVVHIKGVDIVGHDDYPLSKLEFIELIDKVVGLIMREIPSSLRFYLGVASDHSTPCRIREHTADPVPVFIYGDDVLTDEVEEYGERACARGGLSRINANEFILILLDLIGVTYRFGR